MLVVWSLIRMILVLGSLSFDCRNSILVSIKISHLSKKWSSSHMYIIYIQNIYNFESPNINYQKKNNAFIISFVTVIYRD